MTADEAQFDVVVAGSGAAGMTAALTAAHHGLRGRGPGEDRSVRRLDGPLWRRDLGPRATRCCAGPACGDTTGAGGRVTWAHVAGAGVARGPRGGRCSTTARTCCRFVLARTPVDFAWVPGYADYYPEAPGGLVPGRSVEPVPLDGRVLGAELARLNPAYVPAPKA